MSVEISREGDVAIITLNRTDALNALNFGIIEELGKAFDEIAASDARALLITGAGEKAFCAGADIKELVGRDLMAQKQGAELGQRVFAKLDTLPIPSVALINGFAFGGGLELALACTFRLATPYAKMGLPEVKLGLIPGYGGTQRLPRVVGESKAMELIMTGKTVSATDAEQMGLVTGIVAEDPVAESIAFIQSFSGHSLPVLGFIREAVSRAQSVPLDEGLRIEANLSTLAYQMDDSVEGMRAFVEKRQANFKDR